MKSRRDNHGKPVVQLALQGGGAHGAFTWGVLDGLLEAEDIDIGKVSGTSAGALNGAALVAGLRRGGRGEAKANLAKLWERIAQAGVPLTMLTLPLRKPSLGLWDDAMPLLSPYQTNPMGMASIRYILEGVPDMRILGGPGDHALYVNAVNAHSGANRVFGPEDLSLDAILASACAPLMFQAVQIDGESYWDGSYGANPSLWPLYSGTQDVDLLMVELAPLHRAETPTTAKNILNRINEIASINGLVGEMNAMDMVNRTVKGSDIRMHLISLADCVEAEIEPSVKRTVGLSVFEFLRRSGYSAFASWREQHGASLGVRSTVDIDRRYLSGRRPGAS